MKRKKLLFFFAALSVFLLAVFLLLRKVARGGFEKELVPSFTELQNTWSDIHGPYILTRWKQDDGYAAFTPDSALLGCWSVAFAQVLAYHKLSPSGKVNYTTTGGKTINQDFHEEVKWERIINSVDSDTQ